MPGQRRTIRDQFAEHWTPRARATAGLAALAVLAAAGTAAFVFLTGGNQRPHPRPLSTTLASQQLVGLAVPGPGHGSPQRLLAPSANAASFIPGGPGATVLPNEQWQADKMTDGSYVLVYVPDGTCLNAVGPSWRRTAAELSLKACDLGLTQRWRHPYLGKDALGRDYWQLRSQASGLCLSAAGTAWIPGAPAELLPCGGSFAWQQLVEFWSAY